MTREVASSKTENQSFIPDICWIGLMAISAVMLMFVSSANAQQRGPKLFNKKLRGARAAATLEKQGKARKVANINGMSAKQLKKLLKRDGKSAVINEYGELLYEEFGFVVPEGTGVIESDGPTRSLRAGEDVFKLHSNVGANITIFLDFDGHNVQGTAWPNYNAPAFDTNGDRTVFTASEQAIILEVFERVAEDFAPFDVDVTTEDPGIDALEKSSSSDQRYGTRALITVDDPNACSGCGGVAYLVGFGNTYYQPAYVFYNKLGSNARYIAEATSHEVGHNLGLSHDGTKSGTKYYRGHGSGQTGWASIMGVGYYQNLTQWSKGEYADANNQQDDLAIIESKIPLKSDDHGDSRSSATVLNQGSTFAAIGLIESRSDVDYFEFSAGAGDISIDIDPEAKGPNVDLRLAVYNASGTKLGEANPASYLDASLVISAAAAGTYYLSVEGVGKGDPNTTGYTDYASLGQYTVFGTLTASNGNESPVALATASSQTGIAPLAVQFDGTGSVDPDGSIVSYSWNFGDGNSATGANVSHTFGEGVFDVTLTVVDDGGLADTDTITIASNPAPNVPPTAQVSITSSGPYIAGQDAVQFSSAGSSDSDGSITSYQWNFGDGSGSTAANPSHVFSNSGTFTVSLTVVDNDGDSDSATVSVTIDPDPNFLAAPTNLIGSVSGSNVTLTWNDNSANETGFQIRRGIQSGKGKNRTVTWSDHATVSANTRTFTDSGLSNGTYLYTVHAFSSVTTSALSSQAKVSVGKKGGNKGRR